MNKKDCADIYRITLIEYFLCFTWEDEGLSKINADQKLETQRSFRVIISETARVKEGSTGCPGASLFSKPFVPDVLR